MEEADDFAFGAGVEAGGDFVAEEDFGVGDEFHGETEATFLSAREDFDVAVSDGAEAGFFEDAVDAVVEFRGVFGFHAEAGGGFDGFIDGEGVVCDGELGDVAEF